MPPHPAAAHESGISSLSVFQNVTWVGCLSLLLGGSKCEDTDVPHRMLAFGNVARPPDPAIGPVSSGTKAGCDFSSAVADRQHIPGASPKPLFHNHLPRCPTATCPTPHSVHRNRRPIALRITVAARQEPRPPVVWPITQGGARPKQVWAWHPVSRVTEYRPRIPHHVSQFFHRDHSRPDAKATFPRDPLTSELAVLL